MKKSQAILSRAGCVRVTAELNLIPYRITVPVMRFKYVIVPGAAESLARFGPPGSDPGTPTPGSCRGPVLGWEPVRCRSCRGWPWLGAGCLPGAGAGPYIFRLGRGRAWLPVLYQKNRRKYHENHSNTKQYCFQYLVEMALSVDL